MNFTLRNQNFHSECKRLLGMILSYTVPQPLKLAKSSKKSGKIREKIRGKSGKNPDFLKVVRNGLIRREMQRKNFHGYNETVKKKFFFRHSLFNKL